MSFGFIVLRHVNSENTNHYWNEAVISIRSLYSKEIKIVVIDDNSKEEFIREFFPYENVEYVQSEYPQRGELLPFIYYQCNKYFDNAVIIHDSIFIKRKINFQKFVNSGMKVVPFWHFQYGKDENMLNTLRILKSMRNTQIMEKNLMSTKNVEVLGMKTDSYWDGCFGTICFINHTFLNYLQTKYHFSNMIQQVKTKSDRCSLERIIGIMFFVECNYLKRQSSLFGNIHDYRKGEYGWGYTYEQHRNYIKKHNRSIVPVVKVWSGR
jgi:hypothetical protein